MYMAGVVISARAIGGGAAGKGSTYIIDGEDGRQYGCEYTDIVTEGFRSLRPGNLVRFVPAADELGLDLRAKQILKLDEPTVGELYGHGVEPRVTDSQGD
jgi:hypothetical protein